MTLLITVRLWLIEFFTRALSMDEEGWGMEAVGSCPARASWSHLLHSSNCHRPFFFFVVVGIRGGVIPMRGLVVTTPQRKCPIMSLTGFKEPEIAASYWCHKDLNHCPLSACWNWQTFISFICLGISIRPKLAGKQCYNHKNPLNWSFKFVLFS